MNDLHDENIARVTRRQLFGSAASGVGLAALASLFGDGDTRGVPEGAMRYREVSPDCRDCRTIPPRRSEWSSSGKAEDRRMWTSSTPSRS